MQQLVVHLVLTLLNLKVKTSSFLRPVTTQSEALFVPHPGVTPRSSPGWGKSKIFHEPCRQWPTDSPRRLPLPAGE